MDTGDFDSGDVGGHGGHGGHDGAFDLGVGFGSHCGHGHLGFHSNVDMSMTGGDMNAVNKDSRRDYCFKVVGHAEAQIALLVKRLTEELKLVERPIDMGGQRKLTDPPKDGILAVRGGVGEPVVLPEGGVEGAKGLTVLWRNFYTLDSRTIFDRIALKGPFIERGKLIRVRVSAVQWYLPQFNDYETRVVISVLVPNSEYNSATGQYCINGNELSQHLEVAQKLAASLNKALTDARADDYSVHKRAQALSA